jgi:hypothetical protein
MFPQAEWLRRESVHAHESVRDFHGAALQRQRKRDIRLMKYFMLFPQMFYKNRMLKYRDMIENELYTKITR